jgi:hypothetical protein
MKDVKATTFQIVIKDLGLSETEVEAIATKLKKVALDELAKIDNRGDFRAKPLPTARGINGGQTAGMTIDYE